MAVGKKQMKCKYTAHLVPIAINRFPTDRFNSFISKVDIPVITDARDGFWVDIDFKFTRDDNARFWVPPSQIRYVERITEDE